MSKIGTVYCLHQKGYISCASTIITVIMLLFSLGAFIPKKEFKLGIYV